MVRSSEARPHHPPQPISFNYPFELSVPQLVGKPLRNGEGTAGVYLFTNKINGDHYVGRLRTLLI